MTICKVTLNREPDASMRVGFRCTVGINLYLDLSTSDIQVEELLTEEFKYQLKKAIPNFRRQHGYGFLDESCS